MASDMGKNAGLKRSAISVIGTVIFFGTLYYLFYEYIFTRRRDLFEYEVIVYVFAANILALFCFYMLVRMFRWIVEGFRADRRKE